MDVLGWPTVFRSHLLSVMLWTTRITLETGSWITMIVNNIMGDFPFVPFVGSLIL